MHYALHELALYSQANTIILAMRRREQQPRRVFVPQGQEIEIILQGGTIMHIRHQPDALATTFRSSTEEAQQEELRAKFPQFLGPHVKAVLDQHGYRVLGGETESGEATLMETRPALEDWMREAKAAGLTREEVLMLGETWLGNVRIAERRMGEGSPIAKGIKRELTVMSEAIWPSPRRRH